MPRLSFGLVFGVVTLLSLGAVGVAGYQYLRADREAQAPEPVGDAAQERLLENANLFLRERASGAIDPGTDRIDAVGADVHWRAHSYVLHETSTARHLALVHYGDERFWPIVVALTRAKGADDSLPSGSVITLLKVVRHPAAATPEELWRVRAGDLNAIYRSWAERARHSGGHPIDSRTLDDLDHEAKEDDLSFIFHEVDSDGSLTLRRLSQDLYHDGSLWPILVWFNRRPWSGDAGLSPEQSPDLALPKGFSMMVPVILP